MMKKEQAEDGKTRGFQFGFQSYGVKIGVRTDSSDLLIEIKNDLDKINPHGFEIIDDCQVEHLFRVESKKNKVYEIIKDEDILWSQEGDFLSFLQSQIRLTIAEFAESRVFLHAGAVGWKGKGIIIPARSFSGKSSLVAELIKRGALYYSDDFAILDSGGMLHPFHRKLSLRGFRNKYEQADFSVAELGGNAGYEPIPIGMVLITEYGEGNKNPRNWKPEILSGGRGLLEIISHTIPIRYNPKFSLEVLNKVAGCAIICKSRRGEAKEFVDLLLNFFETKVIK